jgi:hypothetical protein
MVKLIVAFRKVANAPKMDYEKSHVKLKVNNYIKYIIPLKNNEYFYSE